MPLHVSSICAHHQEVKIALHSLTYMCDDTRGCVMQFWPPDDEDMCSKHVEAWNKLIVKQKFCASSWLITDLNCYVVYMLQASPNCSACFILAPHSWGFEVTHNDAPQSVGLPWTSGQLITETSTWQHTTLTTDKFPCSRWDSNPRFQQANGRRRTP